MFSDKITKEALYRALLFVAAVAIICYFLPRRDKFEYEYSLGKPWVYSLLTAPFDIPISLDSASIEQKKDSIDRSFVNVYVKDTGIKNTELSDFNTLLNSKKMPQSLRNALYGALAHVYDKGIIDSDSYRRIRAGEMTHLRMRSQNTTSMVPVGAVMSPREAYYHIDSVAVAISDNNTLLQQLNISNFIEPNILIDSITSNRLKNEEYKRALAPIGLLLKGTRIIDRGDVVTPQTFNILNTYRQMKNERGGGSDRAYYPIVGQTMLVTIVFIALFLFLKLFRWRIFNNMRSMTFLMLLVTIFSVAAFSISRHFDNGFYIIPFATIPLLLTIFFDSRTALFVHICEVLICSLAVTLQLDFILLQFIAGMTAIISIKELSKRSQLLSCAFYIFLAYSVTVCALTIVREGTIEGINTRLFLFFGVNAALLFLAYILIFIIEKLFGFTSTVTLVELSDVNNPLLRELSEECPGTFQHSLQVANLATEAARKINANVQLVRTGAMYHDIGKLGNPAFFTENQHGVNPHEPISPEQSAQIVINHVKHGVKLAEREKLPSVIIDFITQHHGKGRAKYFYNTACNKNGTEVDPAPFTYPGPNPQTKETSIMMMADAVEAASRSLSEHTDEALRNLVNRIIDSQIADGLLNDSPLSFKDINTIKETFIGRLKIIYHTRIKYPELKK
ncbi:MAG: HDIG domain-containing protein [Bacteroidales bacterium]|nr:HDIG domain-containing protein [Bacteroidales bacterium]